MLWANGKLRLLVTSACNLDCFYCHNEGQAKRVAYLSDRLFDHVKDLIKVAPGTLDRVTFSGGEPLLHPRLEHLVERLSPYAPVRTIVTNGLLLTPKRLRSLANAGVTKFRIGVDSFERPSSRPSRNPQPHVRIVDVIDSVIARNIGLELNVVLTRFNSLELPGLIRFCQERRISAKFFEHVSINGIRVPGLPIIARANPHVSFADFHRTISNLLPKAVHTKPAHLDGTNDFYASDGFIIRYCRLLCESALCYLTGTRIGPGGEVSACLTGGRFTINPDDQLTTSARIIEAAVREGCATRTRCRISAA